MSIWKQLGKRERRRMATLREHGATVRLRLPSLAVAHRDGGGFSVGGKTYKQAISRAMEITENGHPI